MRLYEWSIDREQEKDTQYNMISSVHIPSSGSLKRPESPSWML